MAQLDARRRKLKDEFAAAHGCWSPMWDGVPALSPEGVPVSMEAAKRQRGRARGAIGIANRSCGSPIAIRATGPHSLPPITTGHVRSSCPPVLLSLDNAFALLAMRSVVACAGPMSGGSAASQRRQAPVSITMAVKDALTMACGSPSSRRSPIPAWLPQRLAGFPIRLPRVRRRCWTPWNRRTLRPNAPVEGALY